MATDIRKEILAMIAQCDAQEANTRAIRSRCYSLLEQAGEVSSSPTPVSADEKLVAEARAHMSAHRERQRMRRESKK